MADDWDGGEFEDSEKEAMEKLKTEGALAFDLICICQHQQELEVRLRVAQLVQDRMEHVDEGGVAGAADEATDTECRRHNSDADQLAALCCEIKDRLKGLK